MTMATDTSERPLRLITRVELAEDLNPELKVFQVPFNNLCPPPRATSRREAGEMGPLVPNFRQSHLNLPEKAALAPPRATPGRPRAPFRTSRAPRIFPRDSGARRASGSFVVYSFR